MESNRGPGYGNEENHRTWLLKNTPKFGACGLRVAPPELAGLALGCIPRLGGAASRQHPPGQEVQS